MMQRTPLLLILIFMLAACSGTSDVATAPPNTLEDNNASEAITADLPPLDETYTGENPLTGAILSVQYPSMWTAQGIDASLQLTDASVGNASTPAEGTIFVSITPIDAAQLGTPETPTTPLDLLNALTTSEIQTDLDTPISLTVGGNAAAIAQGGGDTNDILVYIIQFGESNFMNITALSEAGTMALYEPIIAAIAETTAYTPGEIPEDG